MSPDSTDSLPGNSSPSQFLLRLTLPAAVLLAEVIAASVAFDTRDLAGKGQVLALISETAPIGIRFLLLLVSALVVFGVPKWKSLGARFRSEIEAAPADGRWLGVHVVSAALLVPVSLRIFEAGATGIGLGLTAIAAVLTLAAVVSAVLWALPMRVLGLAARVLGGGWILAGLAAVAATFGGSAMHALWQPSARLTFSLVGFLISPFLSKVVSDPSRFQIGSESFSVEISPDCSGYEGVGLVLAFSVFWLWYFKREYRFPAALLLVPASAAAMWILNSVRIGALILIGHFGAPSVALGGFHSQAGWIAFILVAIGLCVVSKRVPLFAAIPESSKPAARGESNAVAAYLVPFLAILAASMISRAVSGSFEWLYPLRFVAAAAALWFYRRDYASVSWRFGPLSAVAGVTVLVIWIVFDRSANAVMGPELAAMPAALRALWMAVRALGAVITVPIAEELAFRGFLMRRLVAEDFQAVSWRVFSWIPFLVSSFGFGLLHGGRWIEGTIAGMVYAGVMMRSGRLGDAIAAHALTNALLAGLVIFGGQWQYW